MTVTVNIGKYRVLHQLATGGMGEVFLARNEGPGGFTKLVVVKRILPHLARDPVFVKMFLNEAKLAALLQHPNLVQIFELGEHDGSFFLAMEPVLGHTLREICDRLKEQGRPFPPQQLARIAAQILNGLHYAHTLKDEQGRPLGLVHRDVSPENVMVGFNGAVKLLDFGIAKAVSSSNEPTAVGAVKGKFAYMSPEQLKAHELDGRTDVWSVGVLLYELLSGQRPFTSVSDAELVRRIEREPHRPLDAAAPGTPPELVKIVHRALEKDRARRFPTAEAMAAALERWVEAQRTTLTNSQTSAFMREVYGAEAEQVLASVSASGRLLEEDRQAEIYLSGHHQLGDPPRKKTSPRRRALMFGASAAAALFFVVGVVLVLFTPAEGAARPVRDAAPVAATLPTADPGAPLAATGDTAPVDAGLDQPPPEEASPLPAKVRKRGVGKLALEVTPWAEVYEGRNRLGLTPMQPFELPVGRHVLTFKNPQLGATRQVTVKVSRNALVPLKVDLSQP